MSVLALDLTYKPYGGSYSQIINLFKFIDEYKAEKFIVYSTKKNYEEFKKFKSAKVNFKVIKFASFSKFTRVFWVQILLPFYLIKDNVSLLFSPGNYSPIFSFTKKIQLICTIGPFEKNFYKGFSCFQKINLMLNKYIIIFSSFTSSHVIFESEYTRNLFKTKYSFDASKSSVIYLGKDSYFYPKKNITEPVVSAYKDQKYLLSVSHLYPYKNIETLLKSFRNLKDKKIILLIAGLIHTKSYHQKLVKLSNDLSISNRVIFMGGVTKSELRDLYSSCTILVFSSPFENFAFTLIEAMSCGAAIVAANSTAMPETCGSAALYFNPYSSDELSEILNKLLQDDSLIKKYKLKSVKRSSEINDYREVNQKTSKIINNILESSSK